MHILQLYVSLSDHIATNFKRNPNNNSNQMEVIGLLVCAVCNEAVEVRFPSRSNHSSDASYFYQLTLALLPTTTNTANNYSSKISHLQLIRVPKASSTSMSVVARRMAGCSPPGPCCKYPGDPPGSCPDRNLYDCKIMKKVLGCTGHHGDLLALRAVSVKSLSMMRQPVSRSISAFHYPGMHHNSDCKKSQMKCFEEYLVDDRWSNVALKMFVGDFAYANVKTCNASVECKHALQAAEVNLNKLTFLGVAEVWELSLLVLHHIFPTFAPQEDEFAMGSQFHPIEVVAVNKSSNSGLRRWLALTPQRVNNQSSYFEFSKHVRHVYAEKLQFQNRYDFVLYERAVQWMCGQLHRFQLWGSHEYIRSYWRQRISHPPQKCS